MRIFREACGMKVGLPATRAMLEFGALLLRTETELLLKSRWVVPTRLKEAGFTFKYPHFKGALDAILSDPRGTGF
jgi:NAD dependent epimerase/dehydratase family enzyme